MPDFKTAANSPLGTPDFNPTQIDDTAKIKVGTIRSAYDETQGHAEFIYLPGVASCVAGSVVVFNAIPGAFTTTLAASGAHANKGRSIAVAMAAVVAGKYGWFQISGVAAMKVLASFAAGNTVFLTTTAGSVDDAAVNGAQILPAISVGAIDGPAAGLAYVYIDRSFVQGQVV